jgi:tetratricopeptide (TPR) repeat protein
MSNDIEDWVKKCKSEGMSNSQIKDQFVREMGDATSEEQLKNINASKKQIRKKLSDYYSEMVDEAIHKVETELNSKQNTTLRIGDLKITITDVNEKQRANAAKEPDEFDELHILNEKTNGWLEDRIPSLHEDIYKMEWENKKLFSEEKLQEFHAAAYRAWNIILNARPQVKNRIIDMHIQELLSFRISIANLLNLEDEYIGCQDDLIDFRVKGGHFTEEQAQRLKKRVRIKEKERIGNLYLDEGKFSEAEVIFEEIIALDKTEEAQVCKTLGNCYYDAGREQDAYKYYRRALDTGVKIFGIKGKYEKLAKKLSRE